MERLDNVRETMKHVAENTATIKVKEFNELSLSLYEESKNVLQQNELQEYFFNLPTMISSLIPGIKNYLINEMDQIKFFVSAFDEKQFIL